MALKHVDPGEVVHLGAGWAAESRTAALVKRDRFEAIRIVVSAGNTIPTHQVTGFITLHCLNGHVVLVADRDIALRRGDWVYLDRNAPHSVRGVDDSVLLLTILFD
jgi:quercetin dioxygenase-like cupin family protein